jgi:hypothetical protein
MAPKKVMKAMKAMKAMKSKRNKVALEDHEGYEEPLWIEENLFDDEEEDVIVGTSSSSSTMYIYVKCPINEMIRLEVKTTDTIGIVKSKIEAETGIAVADQALYGRHVLLLYPDSTIGGLRVENNEIFECRYLHPPPSAAATAASGTAGSTASSGPTTAPSCERCAVLMAEVQSLRDRLAQVERDAETWG